MYSLKRTLAAARTVARPAIAGLAAVALVKASHAASSHGTRKISRIPTGFSLTTQSRKRREKLAAASRKPIQVMTMSQARRELKKQSPNLTRNSPKPVRVIKSL